MKKVIEFRYIPPEEYFTPLMHLPIQRTIIDVKDGEIDEDALARSLSNINRSYLRIEDSYFCDCDKAIEELDKTAKQSTRVD